MRKPQSIGSLLDGLIARKEWTHKFKLHQVFLFWTDVVGEDVARWAKPSIIRGRILWISVIDSVWMQQLYMQKILLLEKLNERLPGSGFTDLRFQVDSQLASTPPDPEKFARKGNWEPSQEEQEAFRKALDTIPDPEIRESLFKYWHKVKKVRRNQRN